MYKLVKTRVVTVWIVLLSILFGSVAPAISHATVMAAQADEAVQVCTMEGMKTIVVAKDGSGKPAPSDHLLQHCPYCGAHGAACLALPGAMFLFAVIEPSAIHPPLFYEASAPLFAWIAPAPRGPPILL